MPQSGVLATPHKGLKRNATVGRLSDITDRALKEIPQSDVWATSQIGL